MILHKRVSLSHQLTDVCFDLLLLEIWIWILLVAFWIAATECLCMSSLEAHLTGRKQKGVAILVVWC